MREPPIPCRCAFCDSRDGEGPLARFLQIHPRGPPRSRRIVMPVRAMFHSPRIQKLEAWKHLREPSGL
jgi:hypothetical protein